MATKITFKDKSALQNDETIADENKITDKDINEIKKVVNNNAEELQSLENTEQIIVNSTLTYKGTVENYNKLGDIENPVLGDIYTVIDEDSNYVWNGIDWIYYGNSLDFSKIDINTYNLILTANVATGGEITLPFYYKVGANVLQVYYMGQLLLLSSDDAGTDGHYREVGEADSISNKIKITTDWSADKGEYFKFVIKGVYEQ